MTPHLSWLPTLAERPRLSLLKGEPIKRIKGRADRAEAKVKQQVRALVAARDGDCRLTQAGLGVCGGESEWCHLGDKRRARTRGMQPEIRHTTADSMMACSVHHRRHDAGEIAIEYLTRSRADGRMSFRAAERVYVEPVTA